MSTIYEGASIQNKDILIEARRRGFFQESEKEGITLEQFITLQYKRESFDYIWNGFIPSLQAICNENAVLGDIRRSLLQRLFREKAKGKDIGIYTIIQELQKKKAYKSLTISKEFPIALADSNSVNLQFLTYKGHSIGNIIKKEQQEINLITSIDLDIAYRQTELVNALIFKLYESGLLFLHINGTYYTNEELEKIIKYLFTEIKQQAGDDFDIQTIFSRNVPQFAFLYEGE